MMKLTRFTFLFFIFLSITVFCQDLSFQLFVYDKETNEPLETVVPTSISVYLIDNDNNTYFNSSHDQVITNGVVHVKIPYEEDTDDSIIFDQEGLSLIVDLTDLDDRISLPVTSVPVSIVSRVSDRTSQIYDTSIFHIDYELSSIGVGRLATVDAVVVSGSLLADQLIGDAQYVYNVEGAGLNDDHSLEWYGSRRVSNKLVTDDSDKGQDAVYISNDAFVGIRTTDPKMPLDVFGRVLFRNAEENTGIFAFPLTIHQGIMAWDSEKSAFKAGYVSRNISVEANSFSDASVAIGNDIALFGNFSAVLGGESNSVTGNYSVVIGGNSNDLYGNYSVSIGGTDQQVLKGYSSNIGGDLNELDGYNSLIIGGDNNSVSGENSFVFGNGNMVSGDNNMILSGTGNILEGDENIVFGDQTVLSYDNAFVLNVTNDETVYSSNNGQMIWTVGNGVAVLTENYTEVLNIGGDIQARSFSGDGSELTNVSLVDPLWDMVGDVMTITGYDLGFETGQVTNIVSLKHGLSIGDSGTTYPGTLSFLNNNFIGYTSSGIQELSIQDTNTTYNVTSEFSLGDNYEIELFMDDIDAGNYLVFDGTYWQAYEKDLWDVTVQQVLYDRPITFWNDEFLGMLTLASDTDNTMVLVNSDESRGISLQNQPARIGFNGVYMEGEFERFDESLEAYLLQLDISRGSYYVFSKTQDPLLEISLLNGLNFWGGDSNMDTNIPTVSAISNIIVDGEAGNTSQIALSAYSSQPMLKRLSTGEIHLQSSNDQPINFRILKNGYSFIDQQIRLQMMSDGEILLSDEDAYSVGGPGITIPEGNVLLDNSYSIGTFDTDRVLQQGVQFLLDSYVLVPDSSQDDLIVFDSTGVGVRKVPQSIFDIVDDFNSSLYLNNDWSAFYFARSNIPFWSFESKDDDFDIYIGDSRYASSELVFAFDGDFIGINTDVDDEISMNIDGNFQVVGDSIVQFTTTDGSLINNLQSTDSKMMIRPLVDSEGIRFNSNGSNGLIMKDRSVGVNGINTDYAFYVDQPAYISDRLQYQDESIEYKIVQTDDDLVRIIEVSDLAFDYDLGFDIISTANYELTLTFQDHFSTFNTIRLDEDLDETSHYILPNGLDIMQFQGEYINIDAIDIDSAGDESGDMDQLVISNELKSGGDIDGDLEITDILYANYLIGDISEMDLIQFPWEHITTENEALVHYEYVITENVGINTDSPVYKLEVSGTTSINSLITPTLNLTGTLDSKDEFLSFVSKENTSISLNQAGQISSGDVLFGMNNLKFYKTDQSHVMGLNGMDLNYRMSFKPVFFDVSVIIEADESLSPMLSFYDGEVKGGDIALQNGDLYIGGATAKHLFLGAGDSGMMYVSDTKKVNIGSHLEPVNYLDVSGNMLVGSDISVEVPADSVIVQDHFFIGTNDSNAQTDVRGTMVVGNTSDYLGAVLYENSLIIESSLLINDLNSDKKVGIDGTVALTGNLHFGDSIEELSFINDSSNSQFIIGYNQDVTNRVLSVSASDYISFVSQSTQTGLYFTSVGVGIGHSNPDFEAHVISDTATLLIESKASSGVSDAQLQFVGVNSGLVGIESSIPNHLVMRGDNSDPDSSGAVFQIDEDGDVDIGYNTIPTSTTAQPTHDAKVDVYGKVHASSNFYIGGEELTHLPIGSIVMWSGRTSELPDGWKLCTGVDNTLLNTTDKCNFADRFVFGRDDETLGDQVGASQVTITSTDDDEIHSHREVSRHSHSFSYTSSHGHGAHTQSYNASVSTQKVAASYHQDIIGDQTYTEEYKEKCSGINPTNKKCTRHRQQENPEFTVHYLTEAQKESTNHSHTVDVSHSHTFSTNNENSHDHDLENTRHEHTDQMVHYHLISVEPRYYTLAFIYLEGVD